MRRYDFLRSFWFMLGFSLIAACGPQSTAPIKRLTIGVISYGEGRRSLERMEPFKAYLAQQTQTVVALEPAYNELNALERMRRHQWSLVFALPGLAAIAMSEPRYQYVPIFRTQGSNNVRSVLVVRQDSPIQKLENLSGKIVALGEPGSAAGYYLPLYDLYGLTLAEIRFAPTPKTVLDWISQGTVAAGALSEEQFEQYRRNINTTTFRVIHTSRKSPPGVVLLGPTVDRNQQALMTQAMREAPSAIADDAGYLPTAKVPDYQEFIKLVAKVRPIEAQVRQKPAVLTPAGRD